MIIKVVAVLSALSCFVQYTEATNSKRLSVLGVQLPGLFSSQNSASQGSGSSSGSLLDFSGVSNFAKEQFSHAVARAIVLNPTLNQGYAQHGVTQTLLAVKDANNQSAFVDLSSGPLSTSHASDINNYKIPPASQLGIGSITTPTTKVLQATRAGDPHPVSVTMSLYPPQQAQQNWYNYISGLVLNAKLVDPDSLPDITLNATSSS